MRSTADVRERRKDENTEAMREDVRSRAAVWRSRPSILEFGTTSACNLRCPMCAHAHPAYQVVNARREQRRKLYEEVLPTASLMKPFTLSEPLLSDLDELVPYLEEHGVQLELVTNGELLTAERLELILPHLHRISFSYDSHVPEIFERMRPPAKFAVVDANVRRAMPILRSHGVLTRFNMVLVRDSLPHVEAYVDYVVDELLCESLVVLELVPYVTSAEAMDPFTEPGEQAVAEALDRLLARAEARRLNVDVVVREPYTSCNVHREVRPRDTVAARFEAEHQRARAENPGFCEQAMMYLKVHADGDAYPCCKAPPELRLGNVFEEGLEGVWNSKTARRLRNRMHEGDWPATCRECLFFEFDRQSVEKELVPLPRRVWWGARRIGRRLDERAAVLLSNGRETSRRVGRKLGLPKILP